MLETMAGLVVILLKENTDKLDMLLVKFFHGFFPAVWCVSIQRACLFKRNIALNLSEFVIINKLCNSGQ